MNSIMHLRSAIVLFAVCLVFSKQAAFSQEQVIEPFPGQTVTLALAKPGEKDVFAIVDVKGQIVYGPAGVVKGHENLTRIQTTEAPDKWFSIVKVELVQGRAVVTTEENKVYTIYDLEGFSGRIAVGRVEPKGDQKK